MLDDGDLEHGQEVDDDLFEAGGDVSGMFQPADAAFDRIPSPIGRAIPPWRPTCLAPVRLATRRKDRPNATPTPPTSNP